MDCFDIGQYAYEQESYAIAIEWFQVAANLLSQDRFSNKLFEEQKKTIRRTLKAAKLRVTFLFIMLGLQYRDKDFIMLNFMSQ